MRLHPNSLLIVDLMSSSSALVACPLCGKQVSPNFINAHIDNNCDNVTPSKRARVAEPPPPPPPPPLVAVEEREADEPVEPVVGTSGTPSKPADGPLAARMRPTALSEFRGQRAVVESIERFLASPSSFPSLILWGASGTGKTTIAKLIAAHLASVLRFVQVSATSATLADLRKSFAAAASHRLLNGRRTLMFVDEIHRFSKLQQDAFLPVVEDGTLVLLAATTENPSFSINGSLLSRCTVLVLQPLADEELRAILTRAAAALNVKLNDDGAAAVAAIAGGDARVALNALEQAHAFAAHQRLDAIDRALVERVVRSQPTAVFGAETHFDAMSALHKSIRASQTDAALIYLARMLEAGEDVLYISRRLVRAAAEDVGLADPQALVQAMAALDACKSIGMPECDVILAQCVVYLAQAPKSRAVYAAIARARQLVATNPNFAIPMALRNAPTRLMKELGYGAGEQIFVPIEFEAQVRREPLFVTDDERATVNAGVVANGGEKLKRQWQQRDQEAFEHTS